MIFSHCSDLSNNQIARIVKLHFQDSPLSGDIYLQNNAIAYIEPGSFSHVTSTGDLYVSISIALCTDCDFKKKRLTKLVTCNKAMVTSASGFSDLNF